MCAEGTGGLTTNPVISFQPALLADPLPTLFETEVYGIGGR